MTARVTLLALAILALGCRRSDPPKSPSPYVDKSAEVRRAYLCLYDDSGEIRCAALEVLRDAPRFPAGGTDDPEVNDTDPKK